VRVQEQDSADRYRKGTSGAGPQFLPVGRSTGTFVSRPNSGEETTLNPLLELVSLAEVAVAVG
jgi:hypothetical protein